MEKDKKSWKEKVWEFFRPNKLKLIVSGIFIIFTILSYILSELCPIHWEYDELGSRCSHSEKILGILFIFLPLTPLLDLQFLLNIEISLPNYLLFSLISVYYIILYYVLSCIICSIYKLLSRKKSSKLIKIIIIPLFFLSYTNLVNAISDSNLSNNIMNVAINISSTQNISFSFIQVVFSKDEYISNFPNIVKDHLDFINRTYPIRDQITYDSSKKFVSYVGMFDVTLLLDIARKARLAKIKEDKIIGIFPNYKGYFGFSMPSLVRRTVIAREDLVTTTAHEIGHLYGLCDEYDINEWEKQNTPFPFISNQCPNADSSPDDEEFDFRCKNTSFLGYYRHGCPVENKEIIENLELTENATYLINLMGGTAFGGDTIRRWINVESYDVLLNELTTNNPPVFEEIDYVIISGYLNKSGSIQLNEFYTVDGGYASTQSDFTQGNISFFVKDELNNNIFNISFSPIYEYMDYNGNITEINQSPFLIVAPFENANTFIFINNITNETLAQRNVTPNTPTVNITFPQGNEILENPFNIAWTASDADGGNIYYAVLISDDNGSNYTTLDIDLNQTYYELDPNDFDYSTNYVVKVLATDGVNTGTNVSNTFTLGNPFKITSLTNLTINTTHMLFEFVINNTGSTTLNNINWTLNAGDGSSIIKSNETFSLASGQTALVFIEYNYTTTSNFVVNATANSGTLTSSKTLNINLGNATPSNLDVHNFSMYNVSSTRKIFQFMVKNIATNQNLTDISWSLNTGLGTINSIYTYNLTPNNFSYVFVEYNYTQTGDFTPIASASSGSNQDSETFEIVELRRIDGRLILVLKLD